MVMPGERYAEVRAFTEALCAPLAPEDMVLQSMPDASPTKWHLAHTSWFFETFLLAEPQPFDLAYAVLFNSYYNGVGEQFPRSRRGLLSRPTVDTVRRYRAWVDERVQARIDAGLDERALEVLEVGLQHEEQHQELLLTDLKHAFSVNPLRPAYQPEPATEPAEASPDPAPPLRWRRYDEGLRQIGHAGPGFCFDNEHPRHRVFLEAFEIALRPVTVGEYRAFVEDGGYRRHELWHSEGWALVQERGWSGPLYWEPGGQAFTLAGRRPLHDAEPVCHVSWFEASAYASWAGARLPTEAEWEVASADAGAPGEFADTRRFHPAPVEDVGGWTGMFGDTWEWTASPYTPYPGYAPLPGALGEYNGKFMCNQYVLRGGSCATRRRHVRPTYRNFFPADARWQFSGIRLAR
jgi:ergothioneine biosynthesis protein EgtB